MQEWIKKQHVHFMAGAADPSQLLPARERMGFTLRFHIILVPFGAVVEGGRGVTETDT
ncbi:MAG TPA: hypothetical protein VHC49_00295 [Mycobacteriales bacterium]|nr:hypothetical protein [Mycobacteriales bacterium]